MFDTSNWVQNKDWCRKMFTYEPEYGIFLWNTRPLDHFKSYRSWLSWNAKNAGKKAGAYDDGYLWVKVDRKSYSLHRLVFMWESGYTVAKGYEVDHINGVRDDNRRVNLRVVDRSNNQRNTKIRHNNTSGVVGVCRHGTAGWVASINNGEKRISKFFVNVDDAALWRKEKEVEYGFHENHGRVG